MKKLLMMLVACIGALMLAGCSDSPKDVTEKWMQALVDKDLETANEYSTSSTHFLNALVISAIDEGNSQVADAQSMQASIDAIGDAEEQINGDEAVVKIAKGDSTNDITLKKVDGDWKVNVKK